MSRIRVKICCISSIDEAQLAIQAGADALGLVADMPSGPGIISDERVREIATATPPGVETFLLTSRSSAQDIIEHVQYCVPTTVQIVRHIDVAEYEKIQRALPATRRVQVIHVEDHDALDLIEHYQPFVHAFLLDSGTPNASNVELGGTGRTHDWEISAEFVRRSAKPVFLAGGLKADNIEAAVNQVSPWGLDLCSSVRSQGQLDRHKLEAFMQNAASLRSAGPVAVDLAP